MYSAVVIFILCSVVAVADKLQKRDVHIDRQFKVIGPAVQPHEAHKFRYQVRLQENCKGFCGGTIISSRVVITAAHCLRGKDVKNLVIKAGVTDLFESGQMVGVFSYIAPTIYSPKSSEYDIAVLVLQQELDLSNLSVATLPKVGENFTGQLAEVSGWGKQIQNLTHTTIRLIGYEDRVGMLGRSVSKGTGIYLGDSGGPLIVRNGTHDILIGVVSGISHPLSIYTDVAAFRPWIDIALSQADYVIKVINKNALNLEQDSCKWYSIYDLFPRPSLNFI